MLKFGYISEISVEKGMVRVNFTEDGTVSNLLPVSVPASKKDKYSFPFQINEHVWCLMDEDNRFGVVGGAIYSNTDKPSGNASKSKITIDINGNKLKIEADRDTGDLKISTAGKIIFQSASEITLQAVTKIGLESPLVEVSGNIMASGFGGSGNNPLEAPNGINANNDVVADGISLKEHIHTSGATGSPTSTPLP